MEDHTGLVALQVADDLRVVLGHHPPERHRGEDPPPELRDRGVGVDDVEERVVGDVVVPPEIGRAHV